MKRGKKPTRKQKEMIVQQKIGNRNLNPDKWLVRQLSDGGLVLIHRMSGKTREVNAEGLQTGKSVDFTRKTIGN
jgi:hypothetical protein